MAQLYSCGPALFYVGVDTTSHGGGALFFGVCREPPEIHTIPYCRPLKTDDSGDTADDVQFAGEEAYIFGEFNWYSEKVYRLLQARPDPKGTRGTIKQRDMGRLLRRGGCTYPVWVQFPYAAKIRMGATPNANNILLGTSPTGIQAAGAILAQFGGIGAAVGQGLPALTAFNANLNQGNEFTPMPAGYRFAACYLPQDQMKSLGTSPRRLNLMWHGLMVDTKDNENKSVRVVYDHDMTGIASKQPK